MTTATATYTKLKSGEWGVRIPAISPKGATQQVTVTKKSGETKTETVRIIWSGNGISLAAIVRDSAPRYTRTYRSDNAPGGRRCDYCGSRECARAWNPRALCDED